MKSKTTAFFCLTLCLLCLILLGSCAVPNADPEKATASLEDAGYTVKEKRVAGLIHFGEGLTYALEGSRGDDVIYVLYYENEEAAKKAFSTARTLGESYRPQNVDERDWISERSGKCIYFGTKQAARDAN